MNIDNKNIEYLLSSPFENDRIKAIYFIVKNKLFEYEELIKKLSNEDESINVRYYARKAFSYFESLKIEKENVEKINQELEEQSKKKKIITEKIFLLGDSENVDERILAVKGALKYQIDNLSEFILRRLHLETDETVIATLIKALGSLKNKIYTPILIKYLKHSDFRVVANTIEALSMIDDKSAFYHVISLLEGGKDNRVLANVIEYLKKYDADSALKLLSDMLEFKSEAMVDSALFVLCGFKSKKVLPLLEKLKNHENPIIAQKANNAIKIISESGETELSFQTLNENLTKNDLALKIFELKDKDEKRVEEEKINKIRELLAKASDKQSAYELEKILKEETDEYVLAYAITACSKINTGKNISLLKKFLNHPNARIRANAVEVLGEIEGVDLFSLIKPLLNDKNNRVRANAIIALRKYPNIDHVTHILDMIKTNDKLMILSAIYAIMQIKGETIFLLKDLTQSNDEEIRERALSALDFLGNDLNDLNAKKLLNELGIGTKNIAKSAEYIFSKAVLEQLDVAYDENIETNNLISSTKAPLKFDINSLKLFINYNYDLIKNITIVFFILILIYGMWNFINTPLIKNVVSSFNIFSTKTQYDITLIATANLSEIIKPKELGKSNEEKINKLKTFIQTEKENAKKSKNLLLLVDIGNYLFDSKEISVNTEESFKFLNECEYVASTFGLRDIVFCFNLLEIQPPKFKLPVICTNIVSTDNKSVINFLKQIYFKEDEGLTSCFIAFSDFNINSKLPLKYLQKYSFKDPIKVSEYIFSSNQIKPSEYNLSLGLIHDNYENARNVAISVAILNFVIYIETNIDKKDSTIGSTYLIPVFVQKNKSYYSKCKFSFDKKQKNVNNFKFETNEL